MLALQAGLVASIPVLDTKSPLGIIAFGAFFVIIDPISLDIECKVAYIVDTI